MPQIDNERIASSSWSSTENLTSELTNHDDVIKSFILLKDGKLSSYSADCSIKFWSLITDQ